MAETHHHPHPHSHRQSPHESLGELQVTIIAGRNLRSDGKSEVAYCTVDLPGNKTNRTSSNKNREPVWNESFNFDLMSLDNDEVLIQAFGKRRISADKFLGQIQIPIKLPKEISWHFLTDKPKNPHELPEHMRIEQSLSSRKLTLTSSSSNSKIKERVKSPSPHPKDKDKDKKAKEEKEDKTYITGEISVRLNFTHRFLMKGKSKTDLTSSMELISPPLSPSSSSSSGRPHSPTDPAEAMKGSGGLDLPNARSASEGSKTITVPKLQLSPGRAGKSAAPSTSPNIARKEPERQVSFPPAAAQAIETAFREKLQLVKQKLKEKRELVGLLTTNVNLLKHQPDQEQYNIEMHKLNEMQKELAELEKLEKEFTESLGSSAYVEKSPIISTQSTRQIDRTKSRAQMRERRHTRTLENGMPFTAESRRSSKRFDSLDPDNFADETKYLRHRVSFLETELLHERKMSDLVNSKNQLLEKETKRLEDELEKIQFTNELREKELAQVKLECERLTREVRKLNGGKESGGEDGSEISLPSLALDAMHTATGKFLDSVFRDGADSAYEAIKKICGEVKSISKESKDELEAQRRELEDQLRGVELSIERHVMMQKRVEVDTMSRKLTKKQDLLNQLEQKQKKKDANSEGDYSEDSDDESDEEEKALLSPVGSSDAKLDMLVVKLEKLDKLDELLKKIDNMKYASVSYGGDGQGGGGEQARSYDDMKKELEEFQNVIVDETGKYTGREKEEANIKYEKVFTELSQTKQFKAEVAQQLEEKRRANEPLNRAALEKMLKVFSAENLRSDPTLRDKVLKNPELSLIGLDPKAILAKHQNDFGQYLLRLTELDELRAIRASLPKFRPDQKRQIDWVEILEGKIDNVAKAPPKKPAPPKPPSAKSWKPKPVKADAPPTDMFAELLAKRKKLGGGEEDPTLAPTVSSPRLSSTSSLSSSSSSSSSSVDMPLSSDSSTGSAGGTVRGKLKLAPTKQQGLAASGDTPLGRSSVIAATPPPPPPPPMSF